MHLIKGLLQPVSPRRSLCDTRRRGDLQGHPRLFYLNPGGVWSYGYGTAGKSYTLYAPIESGCGRRRQDRLLSKGNAYVYMNNTASAFVDPNSGTVLSATTS